MQACSMPLDSIFSNVVEDTQEGTAQDCELRKPDLELRLQVENAGIIAEYRKAVEDYCISLITPRPCLVRALE